MVLHLEAGTCESGADEAFVYDVALGCTLSHRYTSNEEDYDFQCPGCDSYFTSVGALLQHAESDFCYEGLTSYTVLGQLLSYLSRRAASLS